MRRGVVVITVRAQSDTSRHVVLFQHVMLVSMCSDRSAGNQLVADESVSRGPPG